MIYADNAATTKLDNEAFEAMKPFLLDEYANVSQPYLFSQRGKKALKEAREQIANCINANYNEIVFTSCGTESDNWAIKNGSGTGGTIITSKIEHHAILNACHTLERQGREIIYAPVSSKGVVDLGFIKEMITADTQLISVMYANNEIGTIQPIKELSKIAHDNKVVFHTDAVQAVGHVPIDVRELGIDLLSASAHKFNGPKGIGFIYIREGLELRPYIDGGRQEFAKRAGTENVAAIVAMAIALKNNCMNITNNAKKLIMLEKLLIQRLNQAGIDYIRNGSENHLPGNISLSFANVEGEVILHRMDIKGICISTGSACDSKNIQISHVLNAIGVNEKYAKGTIRISLDKSNTERDIGIIADALISICI